MIKNIIYVEDGSIDVDNLEESLDETTKIIVYRQGSNPPKLIQLEQQINSDYDSIYYNLKKQLDKVREELEKAFELKMSKKLNRLLDELYTNLFC